MQYKILIRFLRYFRLKLLKLCRFIYENPTIVSILRKTPYISAFTLLYRPEPQSIETKSVHTTLALPNLKAT